MYQFVPDATSLHSGEAGPDKILGLLSVLISAVRNLNGRRQDLKPSVRVIWGERVWRTAIKSDPPDFDIENPGFDQAFKTPVVAAGPWPAVKIVLMGKLGSD